MPFLKHFHVPVLRNIKKQKGGSKCPLSLKDLLRSDRPVAKIMAEHWTEFVVLLAQSTQKSFQRLSMEMVSRK